MKLSFEKIVKHLDWIAILIGFTSLVSSIFGLESILGIKIICFTGIAGFLCVVYVLYAICLWILRPKFDWHLHNGNFLQKVICVAVLTPCFITSVIGYTDLLGDAGVKNSNELVLEDNLYKSKIYRNDLNNKQADPTLLWGVYYHFIDPGNQHMTSTKNGRGWAGFIAILGVFLLNGFLVSSIVGWIDSRKEKWLKGEVRYRRFLKLRGHYVVIGGNDITFGIVSQILDNIITAKSIYRPYVLIQTSRDVESFRRELFSNLTEEQQKLIIIYYGNRTSEEDIKELCLENATEVYIIGEDIRTDDIESYHDTINMECLKLISENIQDVEKYNKENPLVCRVMFEYQTSFNILQVTDVDGQKINFKPFNYYETWAQNVLVCQELEKKENCEYLPLEGFDGIQAGQDKFVHLVVVGMSRMGLAMAIEAAHLAHYPNFCTNNKRTRITFIDASMEQEKHFFMNRFKEMFSLACYRDITNATDGIYNDLETYPWINPIEEMSCKSPYYKNDHLGKDFIDIEWEFINGSIENPNIQQYFSDAASNMYAKLTVAICLPENSRAIAAATYLPDSVYKSDSTLQILVYQRLNDNLLKQINFNDRYKKKLRAFGMARNSYNMPLISISNFIDKFIGDAYSEFNKNRIKNIIQNYNHILTDSDLCELSPSYALILDRAEMQALRSAIRQVWIDWFDQNSIFDDKWEEGKNKLYSDIEERIVKAMAVYDVINKFKNTNTLTDADISELSPLFELIKDRDDQLSLRKEIYDRWREWLNCDNENWEEGRIEVNKEIENEIIDAVGTVSEQAECTNSGKTMAAKMWSNTYNVYSMWTKFRCFGVNPIEQENFDVAIMPALGRMEHNRWIVEQLLLRYRALTSSEQEKAKIIGKFSPSVIKERFKKDFAHLDICSNDKLNEIDYNMAELDQALVKVLPGAYRKYLEEIAKRCQTNK